MKKIFVVLFIFNFGSFCFSQNITAIKKCHDAITNQIIGYGFITSDFVFIPQQENKMNFLISNGKTNYLCSTQPDAIKNRYQIFINQNLEGFSKIYIAAQDENRQTWGLFPIQKIDDKISKLVADCQKKSSEDKESTQIYLDRTKVLLQEMRLNYKEKINTLVANYELSGTPSETNNDLKQIASKEINRNFQKVLDLCRETDELQAATNKAEADISFVIVDRKNNLTQLTTRDAPTPTKVKPATAITLPQQHKQ